MEVKVHIFLSTEYRPVVSFTLRPLNLRGKSFRYPLGREHVDMVTKRRLVILLGIESLANPLAVTASIVDQGSQ
jgi:hypothetical protein